MVPRNTQTNFIGSESLASSPPKRPSKRSPRPTHFLALPLHTNPSLRSQIAAFQAQLLNPLSPENVKATTPSTSYTRSLIASTAEVRGIDPSIVIPPIRFHLTLGVMVLSPEPDLLSQPGSSTPTPNTPKSGTSQLDSSAAAPRSSNPLETQQARTVSTALALLQSLKPRIDAIIRENATASAPVPMGDTPPSVMVTPTELEVVLNALDVLRPAKPQKPSKQRSTPTEVPTSVKDESSALKSTLIEAQADSPISSLPIVISTEQSVLKQENDVWADVLYLAPRETPALRQIADLVHGEFERAGYITETRPLKLHCTLLNTSKRRPARARGQPFCYSDILRTDALKLLTASPPSISLSNVSIASSESSTSPSFASASRTSQPAPVPIALGPDAVVQVRNVELWIMGSRAPDGAYMSCGGVQFGDVSKM